MAENAVPRPPAAGNPDITEIVGLERCLVRIKADVDLRAVEIVIAQNRGPETRVLLGIDAALDLALQVTGRVARMQHELARDVAAPKRGGTR
jgi:hypothetical protein